MEDKKKRKGRKALTDRRKNGDNQINFRSSSALSGNDPRLVALVQFLARRAAEKDFAQLIEQSRRAKSGDEKGKIQ